MAAPEGERFVSQVRYIQGLCTRDPRATIVDPRLPSAPTNGKLAANEASKLDADWRLKFEGWRLGWLMPCAMALGECAHAYLGEPSVHSPLCRLLMTLTQTITKVLCKSLTSSPLNESRMLGDMTQVLFAAANARLHNTSSLSILCEVAMRHVGAALPESSSSSRTQTLSEAAHAIALASSGAGVWNSTSAPARCLVAISDASASLLPSYSCEKLAQLLGSLAMVDIRVPGHFLKACQSRMHELLTKAIATDRASSELPSGGDASGVGPFSRLSRQTLGHIHAWQAWCEHELLKAPEAAAQGYGGAEPLLLPMYIRKRCVEQLLGGPLAVRSALERSVSDALHSLGGELEPSPVMF